MKTWAYSDAILLDSHRGGQAPQRGDGEECQTHSGQCAVVSSIWLSDLGLGSLAECLRDMRVAQIPSPAPCIEALLQSKA